MSTQVPHQNATQNINDLKVDQSATYCIRVAGFLDENWSERLGGLKIITSHPSSKKTMTTLTGRLIDQAALFGVLKSLYDMRLPLVSIECLEID